MTRKPRFEIVRTDHGWHGRFRATNGRIIWWTESYGRKRGAVTAVHLLAASLDAPTPRTAVDERS